MLRTASQAATGPYGHTHVVDVWQIIFMARFGSGSLNNVIVTPPPPPSSLDVNCTLIVVAVEEATWIIG